MHVTDRNLFRPYRATLAILSSIIRNNVEFKWSNPPYEYVFDKTPIDVILGDGSTRKSLERNDSVFTIEENCEENLNGFLKIRKDFLLY